MEKPPLKKYFDQLRFVLFLTSFLTCVSLLLLDYYLAFSDQNHQITLLLLNMNDPKHAEVPKPYSFSINFNETFGCPRKNTNCTTQQNIVTTRASNIPSCIAENQTVTNGSNLDPCLGQYIYVYNLPRRFNEDLLKGCHKLNNWVDMCPYMSNLGLGTKVIEKSNGKVLSKDSWYDTNQFSLEVIFRNTMKHYKCLTNDSSIASAIYVPYYAGLDVGQYLWGFNVSMRDASPKELVKWLAKQPQWKRMYGRDHFMVGGRIGLDFIRTTENDSHWGTKLMFLPEARNMSIMLIESAGSYANDFAIPYPTYFHPSNEVEIFQWQKKMRKGKRPYLFTFAGAPRSNASSSIRSELIEQCQFSRSCKLRDCTNDYKYCHDPVHVIKAFKSSIFCLQPPGDSYTRRSTFDSILTGCIPVFFHPESAYNQYLWHFPKNGSSYSVYIPEVDVKEKRVMINETLSRISESEVLAMREKVISLIPRIIYRNPSSRLETIEDAFDVAVKGILGRIGEIRREIANVTYSGVDFVNMNNTNSYHLRG